MYKELLLISTEKIGLLLEQTLEDSIYFESPKKFLFHFSQSLGPPAYTPKYMLTGWTINFKIFCFFYRLFSLIEDNYLLFDSLLYLSVWDSIHIGCCEISQGYQQSPALEDVSLA